MSKLFISRFVIETRTPMAIHSGDRVVGQDSQIAKDWNNLPYIPATAIAGVWRDLVNNSDELGGIKADNWFGTTSLSKNFNSKASKFVITDGLLLNSKSCLNYGLLAPSDLNDPIYKIFSSDTEDMELKHRDRTAINARGTAKNKSKFDVAIIPVGLRFSFDIEAIIDDDDESELRDIIQLLADRGFTLGSNSSNGCGSFDIIGFNHMIFDIKDLKNHQEQLNNFRKSREPLKNSKSNFIELKVSDSVKLCELFNIRLKAEDTWRIGNLINKNDNVSESYYEEYLVWSKDKYEGKKSRVVIMGSTIKGIILHRTLYHYLKLKNLCAENFFPHQNNFSIDLKNDFKDYPVLIEDFTELFGYASTTGKSDNQACKLVVPDTYLINNNDSIKRAHIKIDCFSGAPIETALFNEIRITKPQFDVKVYIDKGYKFKNVDLKEALKCTLIDIAEGFLPISSGSGREAGITKIVGTFNIPEILK